MVIAQSILHSFADTFENTTAILRCGLLTTQFWIVSTKAKMLSKLIYVETSPLNIFVEGEGSILFGA